MPKGAWMHAWALLLAVVSVAPAGAQVVEYYHLDALGSVRAVSNQDGVVIEQRDYLPFGEEWCGTAPCAPGVVAAGQPRRFTGKERDAETGLDYFGARHYGAKLARFTTIDPVYTWEENLVDPQRWNRYAYVRNNPGRYVDPDGKVIETPLDVIILLAGLDSLAENVDQGNYGAAAVDVAGLVYDTFATAVPALPAGASVGIKVARGIRRTGNGPAKLLPAFSKSTIDDVVMSSARAIGQTTQGARALDKKLGHAKRGGYRSAFDGIESSQENADILVRSILSNPSRTDIGHTYVDAYNAAGQGVRFEVGTDRFVGFLEGSLAHPTNP